MNEKTELLCSGVNTYIVCIPIRGILLGDKAVRLPEEYKDWTIEKAVYSPKNDKIYAQISYKNLRKIITL